MNQKKSIKTAIISIGVSATLMMVAAVVLWNVLPHRENGFKNGPVSFYLAPLLHDPYTYSDDSPYIYEYSVSLDPTIRLAELNFIIDSEKPVHIPGNMLTLYVDGKAYKVHKAPYESFLRVESELNAYKENVNDDSYVYTTMNGDQTNNMYLGIVVPMKGMFSDPGTYHDMKVGLQGIFDADGNEIIPDTCSPRWNILADRNGRMVPEYVSLNVNMEGLRGVKNGDSAEVIIRPDYDGMEFWDVNDLNSSESYIAQRLAFKGFTATPKWKSRTDNNGREELVLVLNDIKGITDGKLEISFPNGLARGWARGVSFQSKEITYSINIYDEGDEDE